MAVAAAISAAPLTRLAMNWHVEVMAAKLAAVHVDEIRRLIENVPPRYLKSLLGSVAFPAWCLGRRPASGTQLIQELIREGLHAVTRYQPQSDKVMRMHAQLAMIENGLSGCPRQASSSQGQAPDPRLRGGQCGPNPPNWPSPPNPDSWKLLHSNGLIPLWL
jgi:hypothetical protein